MYTSLKCISLQDLNEGSEEKREELLRNLSSRLLSIAKQHECYKAMWRICCDLNDSVLLRNLMVCIWLFNACFVALLCAKLQVLLQIVTISV